MENPNLELTKNSEVELKKTDLINMVKAYIPDEQKDKKAYLDLVNTQVMGVDKAGRPRPYKDLAYFLYVCNKAKLDPIARQIYAIYRWDNRIGGEKMTIQTSIDGARLIAQRSNFYGGQDDAVFTPDDDGTHPIPYKATTTVYRVNPVNGERMPVTATARYTEYVQKSKDGKPQGLWATMPYNQLAKCSEALALRKAFPQELSGIYTEDEMQQADKPVLDNLEAPERIQKKREARELKKQEKVQEVVTEITPENITDSIEVEKPIAKTPENNLVAMRKNLLNNMPKEASQL